MFPCAQGGESHASEENAVLQNPSGRSVPQGGIGELPARCYGVTRTHDRPVHHHGPQRRAARVRVLQLELPGQLEVQLQRRTLVLTAQGVSNLDIGQTNNARGSS